MKFLFVLLLLISPSVKAQSYYPNLAGQRYCELRLFGLDKDQARRIAMYENWDPHRYSPMVTTSNGSYSLDDLDFARWIVQCDNK